LVALKDIRSGGGGSEHVAYESQQHVILGEARSVLKHYRIENDDEDSAQFELLKDWVLEAMITQQERFVSLLENERAEDDQRFLDPASSSPYDVDVETVLGRWKRNRSDQPTIVELLDSYIDCPTRGKAGKPLSAKTKLLDAGRLETIAELVGVSRPVGSISQDDLIKLRDKLVRLPTNYKKMGLGSNAAEAVKNARGTDRKLSVGGVNAYMNTIRGFLVWCMKRKHIQHVPDFTNTQLHDVRPEHARRLPFKPADLKTIFGSGIYAEIVGSSSWKYWGPLLGLYHGLRLGEVCQLKPEDIFQTSDVWCVNITASAQRGIPDKRLKTQHSDRLLPMHPVLVRLGLPAFAVSRPETEKLFPDVAIGRDGHYSSVASKAFRRMLDDCGLTGSKETFHSFRHNFTSAMEDAGLPSSTQDWLGGWAGTTKSERKRYRSRPGLADLKPWMERVAYPELDPVIEGFKFWTA
jgi:integrase